MDKFKIVLDLVRRGAITDEQAQSLLTTEKEYIHYPVYQPRQYHWPWAYPYYGQPYFYNGLSAGDIILTTANGNDSAVGVSVTCACGEENCQQASA